MNSHSSLPLLPLVLDRVPRGLPLALSQEGVPWVSRKTSPIAGQFVLFDSKSSIGKGQVGPMPFSPGQTLIDIDEFRANESVDPFEAILDDRSVRMQWELGGSDHARATVSEEVSRYDKRAIRNRLLRRLRQRLESHHGLWLRLAPVPFPYRTAFHFRVDHDAFAPNDFHRLLDTLSGHENAATHYLNAKAMENAPADALARLQGLDIGSHGYYHHTYRTKTENVQNLKRGIKTLNQLGLEPVGFVAPHGRFNWRLQAAMSSLGIPYSGEFGLAYDEWPFWPVQNEKALSVKSQTPLQIPVHPICLGLFEDPRFWLDYFIQEAEARYRLGEPIFFYGHPTGRLGRYYDLLAQFLLAIDGMEALWKTTARRLAEWWTIRAMIKLTVRRQGETIVVRREGPRPKFRLAIEVFREQRSSLMAMEQPELRFSTESIAWQRSGSLNELHRPASQVCQLCLRDRFKRAIDWEKETPLEEITLGGWRGQFKRFFRRRFG